MSRRTAYSLQLLAMSLLVMMGCSPGIEPIPDEQAQAFAVEIEPIALNILEGLSGNDYEQHARDFNEEMRDTIDPIVVFPQVQDEVIGLTGMYLSHRVQKVEKQGVYWIVTYHVIFERDDEVTMRVSLVQQADAWQVAGLWFDSPSLRNR